MKIKIALMLLLAMAAFATATAQETAASILDKASAQARKENKKVFVMFHASWCSWCKKMDNNMNSETCKKLFNDNYVVAHLVVQESPKNKGLETPGGAEVLQKYNGTKSGLPYWIILDHKGTLLADSNNAKGENLGCPATAEEVAAFTEKLKKTSGLSRRELAIITETFTIKK
ncbi:thioredoxin family protein [uncultured Flavobacterium sp.]|uniref:thioredoxin family protein n=1 Tax=uncultured Flavobacterium sp. TaxID=165435 RepID=UPI0025F6CD79|nr:thioredoxin family protein [uncultured Flavobacterium sp.]